MNTASVPAGTTVPGSARGSGSSMALLGGGGGRVGRVLERARRPWQRMRTLGQAQPSAARAGLEAMHACLRQAHPRMRAAAWPCSTSRAARPPAFLSCGHLHGHALDCWHGVCVRHPLADLVVSLGHELVVNLRVCWGPWGTSVWASSVCAVAHRMRMAEARPVGWRATCRGEPPATPDKPASAAAPKAQGWQVRLAADVL